MENNYLKSIKCDFLECFFLDSVSHSWGVPTMKNYKYLFDPLYIYIRGVVINALTCD